jgi:hypothetical protein
MCSVARFDEAMAMGKSRSCIVRALGTVPGWTDSIAHRVVLFAKYSVWDMVKVLELWATVVWELATAVVISTFFRNGRTNLNFPPTLNDSTLHDLDD